ncbi:MAG: arginine--tRNA ligase [Coprobacillus sp.]|nr:arginine--tRNA ligase [Coprobacillus sp.]
MEITEHLKNVILNATTQCGLSLALDDINIERCRDKSFGDYSTNVAMKYAKELGLSPRDFAQQLKEHLVDEKIARVEVAGPGFINFFIQSWSLADELHTIIEQGSDYGRGERKDTKINVEFVSANPTGEIHVGHARGAAIGDSLCRILEFSGYSITREYYINDAGNQIDNLALSVIERYKQLLGMKFEIPEDGYHGAEIANLAREIRESYGDNLLEREDYYNLFKNEAMGREMYKISGVLRDFRCKFDVFTSEIDVRSNDAIPKEIEYLKGHTYECDGALFLRTTDYLDDKDRVIVKSDGSYTYFMPDIVYHLDKLERGHDLLIDVLGADHHGYINRLKSALMMHGYSENVLEFNLIQMVRFLKDGKEVKVSKRTGDAISLRELIDDVGVDAARYFFVMRSSNMHLDFDLDLAVKQSNSNPVYYAQYAHARLSSVLTLADSYGITPDDAGWHLHNEYELNLVKTLLEFPSEVEAACNERAPYRITNYIQTLAEGVHRFYTECKIVDHDHVDVTKSRLTLCKCAKIVLSNALNLVGVTPVEKM